MPGDRAGGPAGILYPVRGAGVSGVLFVLLLGTFVWAGLRSVGTEEE